eukprot:TRINITY_DN2852_c0_g1_i4.p1 TRINITY_DN2852_c0_g1~~TRINITY_DN2852_c0_g1_i4.p1  ORF type:complete len:412 (-),score=85.63 TRINITY_DN2852_c0_g1_i4:139-1374(-)
MQAMLFLVLFAGIGDATKLQPNLRAGESLNADTSQTVQLTFSHLHGMVFKALDATQSDPLASAARLPMVLLMALAAFFVGGKVAPYIPVGKPFGLAMCAVYVAFSVSIDVSIKMLATDAPAEKKEGDYAFNPICMVLVTEVSKLIISAVLAVSSGSGSSENSEARKVSAADVAYLAIPAAIFTVNNVLVFKALGANETSVFGVFRDTMILWTAAIWKLVFRTDLGNIRMAAIMVIFAGLVVNQFAHQTAGKISWAFLIVIAMTLCNASGSVANEFALKRSKGLDINIQNAVLYTLCIAFSLALLLIDDPSRLTGLRTFFGGFNSLSWTLAGVQACAGLMVSRLLKYTDSVMKTSATCLRGPVFVAMAPFFVAGQHLNAGSIVSALLVAAGCFGYLSQGPIQTAQTEHKGAK